MKKADDLKHLIGRLKSEDTHYAFISRFLQIMYWLFVPVFLIAAYRHHASSGDYLQLIGEGCKVLSFLIFALFFGRYFKEYRYVDYSVPTITMLKKAASRYKPLHGKIVWILLAIVLLDIGLYYTGFGEDNVIQSQLLFVGAILLAMLAGLLVWYIKYKPLRDDALRLIAEIEDNQT